MKHRAITPDVSRKVPQTNTPKKCIAFLSTIDGGNRGSVLLHGALYQHTYGSTTAGHPGGLYATDPDVRNCIPFDILG